jgi:hypothetical protein
MEQKFKLPTEVVELPSKGKLYPADSPLASGKVEMKYMTAKEEDILTNANYIRQGVVIDKLLKFYTTSFFIIAFTYIWCFMWKVFVILLRILFKL